MDQSYSSSSFPCVQVRLYLPSKTAMQSGKAKTKRWILECVYQNDRFYDPIMGWTGAYSTQDEVILSFNSLEEALSFSKSVGIEPTIMDQDYVPSSSHTPKRSYADNFGYTKPPLN